jgi:hypothetical protein
LRTFYEARDFAKYRESFDRGQSIRTQLLFLGGSAVVSKYDSLVIELSCSQPVSLSGSNNIPASGMQRGSDIMSSSEGRTNIDNETKAPMGRFSLPASFISGDQIEQHGEAFEKDLNNQPKPTVFLQYARIDDEYNLLVRNLASRLRKDGVDVKIDLLELSPAQGILHWITEQIVQSNYVLVVCSDANLRRFKKVERAGEGLGATFEGHLIQQEFYNSGAKNTRFIPVVLREGDSKYIPEIFQAFKCFFLYRQEDYMELLATLKIVIG